MKVITLAFRKDGSAELLSGPEKKPSEHRSLINTLRCKGLPTGVVRVEMWGRNCVKAASSAVKAETAEPHAKDAKAKAEKSKAKAAAKNDTKKAKSEKPAETEQTNP